MARSKAFDPDSALDRGLQLFWTRGYEATSLDDLLRGMALSKSSFYVTFGSKHEFLLASMDRYIARVVEALARDLETGDAEAAIAKAFLQLLEPGAPVGGCFIHNCAIELAGDDAAARERVRRGLERLERGFESAIRRGQEAGHFREDCDARTLATFLSGNIFGFHVQVRARSPAEHLKDVLSVVLSALRSGGSTAHLTKRGARHGERRNGGSARGKTRSRHHR
jgi:TetR/AcrR family transcriptional repressor of nem operon